MTARARSFASLVKLSHTIFAAPFAVAGALLSLRRPHTEVTAARVVAIAVCLVTARTAAMAHNRLVDRDIDRQNPRTAGREIPAGIVSPAAATALIIVCCALFTVSASSLGTVTALLAGPVLLVILGYSYAKRFTWAAHLWLGLGLSLAPGGAWIAMGAAPEPGIVALMLAVATWVGGFDILYSLQDEGFDRANGLRSIPARFGARTALSIARVLHGVAIAALSACCVLLGGGVAMVVGIALVAAILVHEHRLVRPLGGDRVDLTRIDVAFFDLNGYVSLVFLALVAVDVLARR